MPCLRSGISPGPFNVSRITVRKALAGLVIEGLLGNEHSGDQVVSGNAGGACTSVAAWTADVELRAALAEMPALMDRAWQLAWSSATALPETAEHLYVVGRSLGLGAAQEIALKCALLLAQNDATAAGVGALAAELAQRGVPLLLAGAAASGAHVLPTLPALRNLRRSCSCRALIG